jgi:hypothetical protein
MSRFIKLSNRIVNTAFITRVDIIKDKPAYELVMATHHINGFSLFGTGIISSEDYRIVACKEKHPESYKAIDDWINNMPM